MYPLKSKNGYQEKDPRSAHWQAALEDVLALFLPDLEKGKILPVRDMDGEEVRLFRSALAKVDISPSLYAAFLPRSVADPVVPPESAEEVLRIQKDKPSCKLIILRRNQQAGV